jgi:hypothetical protein
MASIQRKIIHGHPYYYLVESRRVKGRPRPIVVAYLGSADTLLKRLQQLPGAPTCARLSAFGGVAALYDLAQQLDLVALIDQHAPKRQQGPSLGQYMLVAAINRCLSPKSKLQMPEWLRGTPLPRWLGSSAEQFSAQRFWDNMELLGETEIAAVAEALTQRLIERYQIDLNSLAFDCTNFDTFIDTDNQAELPQRGHAKSKRTDLRIVGLALLVSVDFHVPLLWKVYPGNQHDSLTFAQVLLELATASRLRWCSTKATTPPPIRSSWTRADFTLWARSCPPTTWSCSQSRWRNSIACAIRCLSPLAPCACATRYGGSSAHWL